MRIVDRLGALSGAVGIVLGVVGSDVLGTPPGPQVAHPTGEQDLANLHWLAGNPAAQVGVTLELLGFALMLVFIGYVCSRVRSGGWLATVALAGGVVEVAVKLGSGAPMFAAYMLRGELSPQAVRVLMDMNSAAFVTTWLPMGVFVASAAGAGLLSGGFGRILGWGGVVVGSTTVLVMAATGVHILAAIFVPFLLCLLWILLVSLRLAFRGTSRATITTPTDAVPLQA